MTSLLFTTEISGQGSEEYTKNVTLVKRDRGKEDDEG